MKYFLFYCFGMILFQATRATGRRYVKWLNRVIIHRQKN